MYFSSIATVLGADSLNSNQSETRYPGENSNSQLSEELVFQYLIADIAANRGNNALAALAMKNAVEILPNPTLRLRAFGLAMIAKNFPLALEISEIKIPKLTPDIQSHAMRLKVMVNMEQDEEALKSLISLIEKLPSTEDADILISYFAQTFIDKSNPSRWLSTVKKASETYTDSPSMQLAQAWYGFQINNESVANSGLDRALHLVPDWEEAALLKFSYIQEKKDKEIAFKYARDFLKKNPKRNRFRLVYAKNLHQSNANREALQQYTQLLVHDPENIEALYGAGSLNLKFGLLNRASIHFEKILVIYPEEDRSRLYLSEILSELGNHKEALDLLDQISSREMYLESQIQVGIILSELGRTEDALRHLSDVRTKTTKDQIRVYLVREQILRDSDQPQRALSLLNEALLDIPNDLDLLYARGLVAASLGLIKEHEMDMRLLIKMQPRNAHAYNALGYTLATETDRFSEALELIEKAIELSPGDPYILDSLGWIHYQLGNLNLSLQYLELAMKQQPDAEIAAHLGEVLWKLGDTQKALKVWSDGKNIDPNNTVLIDTLRMFGQ